MSRTGKSSSVQIKLRSVSSMLADRGIETRGKVQKYIDNTVLRFCDPYVPLDTGTLRTSGTLHTDIGSGEVVYRTPYAAKQYYKGSSPGKSHTGGKRGRMWFARMKADRLEEIKEGARRIAGAKK